MIKLPQLFPHDNPWFFLNKICNNILQGVKNKRNVIFKFIEWSLKTATFFFPVLRNCVLTAVSERACKLLPVFPENILRWKAVKNARIQDKHSFQVIWRTAAKKKISFHCPDISGKLSVRYFSIRHSLHKMSQFMAHGIIT